jgi:hypothetical protein
MCCADTVGQTSVALVTVVSGDCLSVLPISRGGIALLKPASATLNNLNFTSCNAFYSASAIFFSDWTGGGSAPVCSYITFWKCVSESVVSSWMSGMPTFEFCNVISNPVAELLEAPYVIYGKSYGMILHSCIFAGNPAGTDIGMYSSSVAADKKFVLTNCVFDGPFPSYNWATIDDTDQQDVTTATFNLVHIRTGLCPRPPTPAATAPAPPPSQIPSATIPASATSLSRSPAASESPGFEPSDRLRSGRLHVSRMWRDSMSVMGHSKVEGRTVFGSSPQFRSDLLRESRLEASALAITSHALLACVSSFQQRRFGRPGIFGRSCCMNRARGRRSAR